MNRLPLLPLALVAWALSTGALHAQLPHIRLDRIFPLGGEVGTSVLVELTGHDMEEVKSLHFDDPGLKAALVKPNRFLVTIAPETRRGSHDVRAVGKYGISGARLFTVSQGLTEVHEQE